MPTGLHEGWWRPYNATKAHYMRPRPDGMTVSLCRKWGNLFARIENLDLDPPMDHQGPDDCKACFVRLSKVVKQ